MKFLSHTSLLLIGVVWLGLAGLGVALLIMAVRAYRAGQRSTAIVAGLAATAILGIVGMSILSLALMGWDVPSQMPQAPRVL